MKRNCISDDFTFRNAKDWACNSSPIAQRLHSKLCLSPFGQHRNEYTHRHYVFISLVILKNRTYLSRPSLGIFERDVHSLIFLSLRQIKPSMSASKCQCCSDWAVSWNLVGSISCAYGVVPSLHQGQTGKVALIPQASWMQPAATAAD